MLLLPGTHVSAADVVRFESLVHEGTEFAQNKLRENKNYAMRSAVRDLRAGPWRSTRGTVRMISF